MVLLRLRAKPVRTASGIAVVAVMSKPHRCSGCTDKFLLKKVKRKPGSLALMIETSTKAGFNIKGLFRKIAGALPGMESVNQTKQDDYVDICLKTTTNNTNSEGQGGGGCAC